MKKTIFTFLIFIVALFAAHAQKGINLSSSYAAGGKMLMFVDSGARNVFYALGFLNQPNTFFNYLPEVQNVSIQINFRKDINVQNYRYTILVDNKPIALNKSIDIAQLKDTHAGGDEEVFRSTTFGIFPIKGKIVTILTYDIEKPQDVYKNIFYGKPLPQQKIQFLSKRYKNDEGYFYTNFLNLKKKTVLAFSNQDDELTIIKEASDIDYLYNLSIKDKQSNTIIFESTTWKYGGYINESHQMSPYVQIDRNVFKKPGDYEVIIQPLIKWTGCHDCYISAKETEKYISRYTLSVTLDQENYTKKELIIYGLIVALTIGLIALIIIYNIKKRNKKELKEQEKQKNTAKLQLNAIRSQLNPHFLFNALSGIQNLMNKNEIDNANKYLSKFARLTRNVLEDKELISLLNEKTLLDDYLQMEQLRFGFSYEIKPGNDLDLDNIEIPSMLLQPFVENAVKHGISKKATNGSIDIIFTRQKNDLVLNVKDNGNGFDTEKNNNGFGLSLSRNRIALLNNIYQENRFILAIYSNSNGTTISLTLTDWL